MATKYIVKNGDNWAIKNTKAGRSTKNFSTQAQAINHAAGMQSTKVIMIQGKNGQFRKMSGWDQTNTENDVTLKESKENSVTNTANKRKNMKNTKAIVIWIIVFVLAIAIGVIAGLAAAGVFNHE